MDIEIVTESGVVLGASLRDTPAGRDFAALLPLTVQLSDFHRTEKIADLPRRISRDDDAPAGTFGRAGDLTVYAPWGNLAIFYRAFTYTEDLVCLGSLAPGGAEIVSGLADGTSITIQIPN